jgi:Helix-turn-helix
MLAASIITAVATFGLAVLAYCQIRAGQARTRAAKEQVAHRIARMDAKYLGEIERGWHAPSISTAKRIADAPAVTLAELTEGL